MRCQILSKSEENPKASFWNRMVKVFEDVMESVEHVKVMESGLKTAENQHQGEKTRLLCSSVWLSFGLVHIGLGEKTVNFVKKFGRKFAYITLAG
ncbi:unnamed protein product [Allacma fusca]|uniref:Uncharacterized protein n=1 Tax=Allacma fusca TaxID=39272 RepID=A0A8J2K5J2_9HEXA|nr:unnamed protein product [Allacma fusca]